MREKIRAATDSFRAAFGAFTAGSKAVSTSNDLGLDVTSPESASRLTSSANLGIDLVGTQSVKVSEAEINAGTNP